MRLIGRFQEEMVFADLCADEFGDVVDGFLRTQRFPQDYFFGVLAGSRSGIFAGQPARPFPLSGLEEVAHHSKIAAVPLHQ